MPNAPSRKNLRQRYETSAYVKSKSYLSCCVGEKVRLPNTTGCWPLLSVCEPPPLALVTPNSLAWPLCGSEGAPWSRERLTVSRPTGWNTPSSLAWIVVGGGRVKQPPSSNVASSGKRRRFVYLMTPSRFSSGQALRLGRRGLRIAYRLVTDERLFRR